MVGLVIPLYKMKYVEQVVGELRSASKLNPPAPRNKEWMGRLCWWRYQLETD
jgi:hypothetical protein